MVLLWCFGNCKESAVYTHQSYVCIIISYPMGFLFRCFKENTFNGLYLIWPCWGLFLNRFKTQKWCLSPYCFWTVFTFLMVQIYVLSCSCYFICICNFMSFLLSAQWLLFVRNINILLLLLLLLSTLITWRALRAK